MERRYPISGLASIGAAFLTILLVALAGCGLRPPLVRAPVDATIAYASPTAVILSTAAPTVTTPSPTPTHRATSTPLLPDSPTAAIASTTAPEATRPEPRPTLDPTPTATRTVADVAMPRWDPTATPTAETRVLRVTIAPEAVYPGDVVTLTWEVEEGLGSVSVWSLEKWGSLTANLGPFPGSAGAARVPTNPDLRQHQHFTVQAASYATAQVSVILLCPEEWLFADPPREKCPIWTLHTPIVAQRFERGWMLWTEADRSIYILPDDKPWTTLEDKWHEGMPEADPGIVAPPGFWQPIRGFGLAWRTAEAYVSGWTSIRDTLGWATGPEYVVGEGFVQQAFTYGKHVAGGDRFIAGPEGGVLHLPQGLTRFTWSVWEGP